MAKVLLLWACVASFCFANTAWAEPKPSAADVAAARRVDAWAVKRQAPGIRQRVYTVRQTLEGRVVEGQWGPTGFNDLPSGFSIVTPERFDQLGYFLTHAGCEGSITLRSKAPFRDVETECDANMPVPPPPPPRPPREPPETDAAHPPVPDPKVR